MPRSIFEMDILLIVLPIFSTSLSIDKPCACLAIRILCGMMLPMVTNLANLFYL